MSLKLPMAAALALAVTAAAAHAEAERYVLDASHSQIIFSWNHLGLSTTYGMFSGFEGEVMFDAETPANSSVSVAIPTRSILTGWQAREEHLLSDDFFAAAEGDLITFTSTGIEVTGDDTALITGDLTVAGTTLPVVLDAKLNGAGPSPLPQMNGAMVAGFDATATLNRSDFGLGAFTPFVGDEISITISIETIRAADIEG